MPVWLVSASWSDDESVLTRSWEVEAPSDEAAIAEVAKLFPTQPLKVAAKVLEPTPTMPLAPGEIRETEP